MHPEAWLDTLWQAHTGFTVGLLAVLLLRQPWRRLAGAQAAYALWLYRKVVFGALVKPSLMSMKDLTFRESLTLFPLIVLTILFGVWPKPVLDMSAASVQQLVNNYQTAVTAVKAAALTVQ